MPDSMRMTLTPEEMRALGYQVIDILVDHFAHLPDKPVTRKTPRQTMEAALREPLPVEPADIAQVLDQLREAVFGNIMHLDHPRFFAFIPSPSNYVSVMAETLATGFNVFAGTWLEASGPAQIELVAIDWLRQACGLPNSAGGLFLNGGSTANLTALAVAKHIRLHENEANAVVYCSDQTHSSVERALRVLGFRPDQLHRLEADAGFRLDLHDLREAVEEDRSAGRQPFCVIANAGTTNTGAVDPLPALSDYCRQEGLWFHVDGAYGASAILCPRGRALLNGLGQADSVTIDPHKWLFQPYEMGCILVRDDQWLRDTFHILPEYLADIEGTQGEINFCDRGIQLTRSFRALKLWMSLKIFGQAGFEAALARGFELAETAEVYLRDMADWEVVTPAQMGIITFRYAPAGSPPEARNSLNRDLVEAMIADGSAMVSSTVLRGDTVLRMCTINPRTTDNDLRSTLATLDALGKNLLRMP